MPPQKRMSEEDIETLHHMKNEGFTVDEIADAIGFSKSAVKKRLYRKPKRASGSGSATPPATPADEEGTPTPLPEIHHPASDRPAPSDDPGPWGQDIWGTWGGEFHELFDHVLKTLQCPKDKRKMAVNMVKLNPQYQTEDQLRNLLQDLKSTPNLAVRAAQMTMSLFYQQSQGYQAPYGPQYPAQRPPGPPLTPPPPGYGQYPQQPPGYGPYPPQPGYHQYPPPYAPYYPPPPRESSRERDGDTMTKAEFDIKLKEEMAKLSEKKDLEDQINSLGNLVVDLKERLESGPSSMRIPVRDANGNVLVTPNGEVVYEEVPAGYQNQSGSTLEAKLVSTLENAFGQMMNIHTTRPQGDPGLSENERELIVAKNRNAMLEVQNELTSQFQSLQNENKMLQSQISSAGKSGLSEEGHIMVEEIRARGKHIEEGIKTANEVFNNAFRLFGRAMQGESHPPGYDAVPQWTNAEATKAASKFLGE